MPLILASASPRRAELLRSAAIDFEVRPSDVDERVRDGEDPVAYACRVAEEKARAVAAYARGRPILSADTIVVLDGQILGKPKDSDDAGRMLGLLSGRQHEVMTAVSLLAGVGSSSDSALDTRLERTIVEFAPLSASEIQWYVSSGEPIGKAGAYAIQGLASRFVTRIQGSYSNVVGLPIALVYRMLNRSV